MRINITVLREAKNMLEMLKFIFSICQEIAKVASKANEKRFADMGKHLLLIYVYMNDVVISASAFLGELERRVECTDFRMMKWGEDVQTAFTICGLGGTTSILRNHSVFLRRLWEAVTDFDVEFAILDAETHRKIHALLGLKMSVIASLLSGVESGKWLVITDGEQFFEEFNKNPGFHTDPKGRSGFISNSTAKENYEIIKNYLESEDPIKRLREIDRLREDVKAIVEKYWNIADLLPDVKHKYQQVKP
jgi:hypothetical protein